MFQNNKNFVSVTYYKYGCRILESKHTFKIMGINLTDMNYVMDYWIIRILTVEEIQVPKML